MTATIARKRGPSLSKAAKDQQDLVAARRGEASGNGHVNGTKQMTTSASDAAAEAAMNATDDKHLKPVKGPDPVVTRFEVPIRPECRLTIFVELHCVGLRWRWAAAWARTGKPEQRREIDWNEIPWTRRLYALEEACGFLARELAVGRDARIGDDIQAFIARLNPSEDGPAVLEALTPSPSPAEGGRGEKNETNGHKETKKHKEAESNGASNVAMNGSHHSPVVAAESEPAVPAEFEVLLADLVRHPDNREPSAESVAARAESLKARGQDETIVVRDVGHKLGKGGSFARRWQVLSGETRWRAAAKLGWKTLRARAVVCDDAQALIELAERNSQRHELTAIDKARLIKRLCDPVDQGGGGKTREEAGRSVGYASGSAASNVVRLLELPKVWQDRVVAGELPETFARCLLRLAKAPSLLLHIEKAWKEAHAKNASPWEKEHWESRDALTQLVEQVIDEECEPLDKTSKRWSNVTHRHEPRQFELTDEVRQKLRVEVIADEKGRDIEVAIDTKAFDDLQEAALKAKASKKEERAQKAGKSAKAKAEPKLSPAEQKRRAQDKARAHGERVAAWRHAWLAKLVARDLVDEGTPAYVILKATIYVLTLESYRLSRQNVSLRNLVGKAVGSSGVAGALNQRMRPADDVGDSLTCGLTILAQVMRSAVLADHPRDRSVIDTQLVEGLIADLEIDVDHEWAQDEKSRREFYELFTSAQLDAIAKTVKVHVDAGKPKSVKVQLLSAKTQRPAAMKGVETKGPAKKKGRK